MKGFRLTFINKLCFFSGGRVDALKMCNQKFSGVRGRSPRENFYDFKGGKPIFCGPKKHITLKTPF